MATAYAVNSRLLRGFCASGPKPIAHKRSFGKPPAPAEGRFPGDFSRSARTAPPFTAGAGDTGPADGGQQAKGRSPRHGVPATGAFRRQGPPQGGHEDPAMPARGRCLCPPPAGPVASAGPTGYSAAMCAKIARQRADQLVFMQGLAESREQARRLIMAGKVALSSAGLPPGAPPQKVDKPGHPYPEGTVFELLGQERFVSRGAYKLLTILDNFRLDVGGMVCLDAGASTGGFTDCLLQHGAARVYAVDVGKNQLHEKLRADGRVINLEGVNLRAAAPELIPEPVDLVVADVSFISLTLILPPCMTWLKPGGLAAVLIKPQFELGPGETVKGVVRDEAARQRAVDKIVRFCTGNLRLESRGVLPAAIKGPKGNQEYMALFARP